MDTPEKDREKSIIEKTAESFGRDMAEAKTLGHVDRADADVEGLFAQGKRTEDSPAFLAVWGKRFPTESFTFPSETSVSPACQKAMDGSLAVLRQHQAAGTLYDSNRKLTEQVLQDLAKVGYWGMLIDAKFGGQGASFLAFSKFLSAVATIEPTVAGLASVHGCIGAVDPVTHFGDEKQQQKYLPLLASGQRLSAFALTEPNAGSDLTAIRTKAVLKGDFYEVTGRKLFITNAGVNRTVGLVCLIDGKQSVLIADLPASEDATFKIHRYGIWALAHANNVGLEFNNFKVPRENLLKERGLMIAYHGLNKGRVALCANAAGVMRSMLANMVPWGRYRVTYTKAIAERELVQRRAGELLGLIVSCDAIVEWCASLLDHGYRGEMECIIAKRFGSESLKEAAIEYFMKTHGGRSFLQGHMFAENIHDFLAPCIYEGEGEMLSMAFFKALTKDHGEQLFLPISDRVGALKAKGAIKDLNPANPWHAWMMRREFLRYGAWLIAEKLATKSTGEQPKMSASLEKSFAYAVKKLQDMPEEISLTMVKHQVALIDRQCRIAQMSQKAQDLMVVACTALWGAKQSDPMLVNGAEIACDRLLMKLTGRQPDDRYFRKVTKLGAKILNGELAMIKDLPHEEVLMPYPKE